MAALNKRVQQPRGSTSEVDTYVGPVGQLIVDVNRNEIRLQDGTKAGGWRIPNLTQLKKMFLDSDTEFGNTSFAAELRGFLVRTADRMYKLRTITATDGMSVANPDGVAGDPQISLPGRLKKTQTYSLLPDNITESGFYQFATGTTGLPSDLLAIADVGLLCLASGESTGRIVQIAFSMTGNTSQQYYRVKAAGLWSSWAGVSPVAGSVVSLAFGSDQVVKSWSAADIMSLVRAEVSRIQYIDSGNVAKAFSLNELFRTDGVGDGTQSGIQGPYNVATNDRFEIIAAATTRNQPSGDTAIAKIEIEVGSTWTVLSTNALTVGANADPQSVQCVARVIINAGGYQTAANDWTVLSTVTGGVPTGRFRVTYGALNQAASRGARWR